MQSGIVALGFDNGSINLGNIFDLLCACLGAGQFSGQGFKRTLNAQSVVYFFQRRVGNKRTPRSCILNKPFTGKQAYGFAQRGPADAQGL